MVNFTWKFLVICVSMGIGQASVLIFGNKYRTASNEISNDMREATPEKARFHQNTGDKDGNPECGEHFEGDIMLPENEQLPKKHYDLNAVVDASKLWAGGIVYYTIDSTRYTRYDVARITEAMSLMEQVTKVRGRNCIKFIRRTTENDYVLVKNGNGCSSFVGRIGGKQDLILLSGPRSTCLSPHGIIMHEFLHALGFFHEQSRSDRDKYVDIKWENILEGYKNNFEKLSDDEDPRLGTSYDYGSVMHYSKYAFAVCKDCPTILPKNPKAVIGQREKLSAIDIERVQIRYKCISPAESKFFKHLNPKEIL